MSIESVVSKLLVAGFLVGSVVGCGKNDDPLLKKARELVEKGNYDTAVSILDDYKTSDLDNMTQKHVLLAEVHYENVKKLSGKERVNAYESLMDTVKTLEGVDKVAFEKVRDKMFLIYDQKIEPSEDNSSPKSAIRTLLYGGSTKQLDVVKKVFDVDRTRKNTLREMTRCLDGEHDKKAEDRINKMLNFLNTTTDNEYVFSDKYADPLYWMNGIFINGYQIKDILYFCDNNRSNINLFIEAKNELDGGISVIGKTSNGSLLMTSTFNFERREKDEYLITSFVRH